LKQISRNKKTNQQRNAKIRRNDTMKTKINYNPIDSYIEQQQAEEREKIFYNMELTKNAYRLAKEYNLSNQIQKWLDDISNIFLFLYGNINGLTIICKITSFYSIWGYLVKIRDQAENITKLKERLEELISMTANECYLKFLELENEIRHDKIFAT
jgi:ABC-type multidrug transport system fused ATPase/permease subunit